AFEQAVVLELAQHVLEPDAVVVLQAEGLGEVAAAGTVRIVGDELQQCLARRAVSGLVVRRLRRSLSSRRGVPAGDPARQIRLSSSSGAPASSCRRRPCRPWPRSAPARLRPSPTSAPCPWAAWR